MSLKRWGRKGNPNNTETHKQCNRCERVLPRSDFYKSSACHDGLHYQCKDCRRAEDSSRKRADRHGYKIDVRVTADQKAYAAGAAEAEGITMAELLRRLLAEKMAEGAA